MENATSPKGGNLNWPGRNNGMRSRAFAVPATASFAIIWPQADPPADVLMRLGELAHKVPYVGRSTSLAELTTSSDVPEQTEGWITYAPARLGDPGTIWQLRVPYVGYTSELEAAYRDGRRAWEVARPLPYAAAPFGPTPTDGLSVGSLAAQQGPFSDLMVWSITPPVVRIGGDMVLALASALRRAIISRVQEPVPAQVSGHDADGRPHVGFLALPDVGHQYADGHILGLALAVPRELPAGDLERLVGAVITDPLSKLRITRSRELILEYGASRRTLQPSRWATRSGTRVWATVTPLMLDGHTRRSRDEASEVARSLVIAGYSKPTEVEVSGAPLVPGAVWRPRRGTIPPGRPLRKLVHARVTFAEPIRGPVLAGSMRYLGLGLFLPADASPSLSTDGAKTDERREPADGQQRDVAEQVRLVGETQ